MPRLIAVKTYLVASVLLLVGFAGFSAEKAAKKASNPALQPNPRKLNPPPGIPVAPEVRAELTAGVIALGKEIQTFRSGLGSKPALIELLPDVEIFQNAVRY